jgi:hypothetical protein
MNAEFIVDTCLSATNVKRQIDSRYANGWLLYDYQYLLGEDDGFVVSRKKTTG